MPSVSTKQARFMSAAAHNPKFAAKAGIPVSVAQEFHEADAGKKYGADKAAKRKQVAEALKR
jgi:hypothetical protein